MPELNVLDVIWMFTIVDSDAGPVLKWFADHPGQGACVKTHYHTYQVMFNKVKDLDAALEFKLLFADVAIEAKSPWMIHVNEC